MGTQKPNRVIEPKFRGWFSQENPMNWDIDNFHLATNSKRFENGTPNPLPYVAGLPGLNWVVQGGNILQEKHNSRMTGELIELLLENRINLVTPIEPMLEADQLWSMWVLLKMPKELLMIAQESLY